MSILSISLTSQTFLFNILFVFSLLALVFELMTGGFLFGILAIIGFIVVGSYANMSWLAFTLSSLGVALVVLEAFYPSKAIFFMLGVGLFLLSCLIQIGTNHTSAEIVVLIISACVMILFSFFFYLGIRKMRTLKYQKSIFSLKDAQGTVLEQTNYAQIQGAMWKVECDEELKAGDTIIVLSQKELTLIVKKV